MSEFNTGAKGFLISPEFVAAAYGRELLDKAIVFPDELEVGKADSFDLGRENGLRSVNEGRAGSGFKDRSKVSSGFDTNGYLGLPVFGRLVLSAGTDKSVLLGCFISVNINKVISKTVLSGRRGSVKELFGVDDYVIEIKGVLVNVKAGIGNNVYPMEEVVALRRIADWAGSVQVESAFLSRVFNVRRLAIEGVEFLPLENAVNVQRFVIRALSDDDVILELR